MSGPALVRMLAADIGPYWTNLAIVKQHLNMMILEAEADGLDHQNGRPASRALPWDDVQLIHHQVSGEFCREEELHEIYRKLRL